MHTFLLNQIHNKQNLNEVKQKLDTNNDKNGGSTNMIYKFKLESKNKFFLTIDYI